MFQQRSKPGNYRLRHRARQILKVQRIFMGRYRVTGGEREHEVATWVYGQRYRCDCGSVNLCSHVIAVMMCLEPEKFS